MDPKNPECELTVTVFTEDDVPRPVGSIQVREEDSEQIIASAEDISESTFQIPLGEYEIIVQGDSFYSISRSFSAEEDKTDMDIHIDYGEISDENRINVEVQDKYFRFQPAELIRIYSKSYESEVSDRSAVTFEVPDTGEYTVEIIRDGDSIKHTVEVWEDGQDLTVWVPPEV
jgi:hypothetical protein